MKIPARRRPSWAALLCAASLAAATPAVAQVATAVQLPKIKYTDFTLPNGLRVLLHEDHSSPIVALEMWYNAGTKQDWKGKTGIAHMFEHMMDEGSLNLPAGEYKRVIQSAGGSYNASTQYDFARYYSQLPSNHLETGLWLEADRMANLVLDSARFALEREAVRNEFRQNVLAQPPYMAGVAIPAALFPGHPYGAPVFGFPADLASITLADAYRFYETFYVPNNAILVIAGDFSTADARKKVEKHFGAIPRGKPIPGPQPLAPFQGEKRLVIEHQANVRGVWGAWRAPKSSSADRPAMMALSSILTQRLRRLLVDERRVAIILNPTFNQSFDLAEAGIFQIAMTPNATAPATMFEEVMDSVIADVKANGVTDAEVRRWVAGYRLQMLTGMQSDQNIASNLADAALNQGNPLGIYEITDIAQRVTPAQVQAAARKYLTGDRVIVSIVPTGKLDLISKPNLPYTNATLTDK